MPELSFHDHADAFRNAIEASETNTHEQYRLRDEIHYADRRIVEMEFDEMAELIKNNAAVDKKSNADERKAEVSKRLKAHGPYMDAVRDRAEQQRQLMIVTAAEAKNVSMARLHIREMDYRTALLNAGAERG